MLDMENLLYDVSYYDSRDYKRKMYNGDSLYQAFIKSRRGSAFKASVKGFRKHRLTNLARLRRQLINRTFRFHPLNLFMINERGKPRGIAGEVIEDRIVEHLICDDILNPIMFKYLIYDNGASQPKKGIDFSRRRLETHLHKYYQKHGSNEGYILLLDFSKYYDNILHDKLRQMYEDKLYLSPYYDEVMYLLDMILERSEIDVSFLSDEEIEELYFGVFNYLDYFLEHGNDDLPGEKFLKKHLCLGNQTGQTSGISYRIPIDNYIKIVCGEKYYGVYNDDAYIISESKEHLEKLLVDLNVLTQQYGIHLNLKKTKIEKLSNKWRYLQIQYQLTDSGKVNHKINPKRLHSMKRKLKKLSVIFKTQKEFSDYYRSWFNSYKRYLSRIQRKNLDELYSELLVHY